VSAEVWGNSFGGHPHEMPSQATITEGEAMDYQTSMDRWNAAEALLETEGNGALQEGTERLSEWTAEWFF
jgi:hypothetical protein